MPNQADGTEAVYADIPKELKYLLDEDDRANKEVIIAGLEHELNVASEDSVAVLDRQIGRMEDRLEDARSEFEHHQQRVQDLQGKLESAREVRDSKQASRAAYDDRLDDLLDDVEDGEPARIYPAHPRLDALSAEFDRPNEEIHLDLEQRAASQDRPLAVGNFKMGHTATDADDQTPITEKWPQGGEQ